MTGCADLTCTGERLIQVGQVIFLYYLTVIVAFWLIWKFRTRKWRKSTMDARNQRELEVIRRDAFFVSIFWPLGLIGLAFQVIGYPFKFISRNPK